MPQGWWAADLQGSPSLKASRCFAGKLNDETTDSCLVTWSCQRKVMCAHTFELNLDHQMLIFLLPGAGDTCWNVLDILWKFEPAICMYLEFNSKQTDDGLCKMFNLYYYKKFLSKWVVLRCFLTSAYSLLLWLNLQVNVESRWLLKVEIFVTSSNDCCWAIGKQLHKSHTRWVRNQPARTFFGYHYYTVY